LVKILSELLAIYQRGLDCQTSNQAFFGLYGTRARHCAMYISFLYKGPEEEQHMDVVTKVILITIPSIVSS
jgi:hypothetical protein